MLILQIDSITNVTAAVTDNPNVTAEPHNLPNVTVDYLQMFFPTIPKSPLTARNVTVEVAYRPDITGPITCHSKVNAQGSYHGTTSTKIPVLTQIINTEYRILLYTKNVALKKI